MRSVTLKSCHDAKSCIMMPSLNFSFITL